MADNSRNSPENMMAEAAPITPKNGEYIGASSVTELIVARFVGLSVNRSRSRVYLQVADRRSHGSSNVERSSRHSRR